MNSRDIRKDEGRDYAFWRAHGGLVWSNPDASDSVMIANALLQPSFHLLLEIASRFGLPRLKVEWEALGKGIEKNAFPEELVRLRRAAPIVERCLAHMEEAVR